MKVVVENGKYYIIVSDEEYPLYKEFLNISDDREAALVLELTNDSEDAERRNTW